MELLCVFIMGAIISAAGIYYVYFLEDKLKQKKAKKEWDELWWGGDELKSRNLLLIESLQESIEETKDWLESHEREFHEKIRKPFVDNWDETKKLIRISLESDQEWMIELLEATLVLREHISRCEKLILEVTRDDYSWTKDQIEEIYHTVLTFCPSYFGDDLKL